MISKRWANRLKKIGIALVIVAVVFSFASSFVAAQSEEGISGEASGDTTRSVGAAVPTGGDSESTAVAIGSTPLPVIGHIVKALSTLFLYIFALFIKLASFLVAAALSFNKTILDFNPPFITMGWGVLRDVANLGFVFGIIIIAIATILRYKDYTAQSILWKLIVAALLINFSLVMAGSVVKVSNSFADYFSKQISENGDSAFIAAKMADMFRLEQLHTGQSEEGIDGGLKRALDFVMPGVGTVTNALIKSSPSLAELGGLMVGVMLEVLIFLVLLGFAGMLFIRYFMLSFLLVLSPIVWLFWVFPSTQKLWKQWWSKFIHWCLYAPAVLFFLWLVLSVMAKNAEYIEQAENAVRINGSDSLSIGVVNFGYLMSSLMALALLIGGMKVAQSVGYGGTSMAMNVATKTKDWTKKQAALRARRTGYRALKGMSLDKAGSAITTSRFAKVPGVGALGRGLTKAHGRARKEAQGSSEDFKKSLSNLNNKEITKMLPSLVLEKRAAAVEHLQSKGKLNDAIKEIGTEGVGKAMNKLHGMGRDKAVSSLEKGFMSRKSLNLLNKIKSSTNEEEKKQAIEEFKKSISETQNKFSPKDWTNYADNIGKEVLSVDDDGNFKDDVLGLGPDATKALKEAYVDNISNDLGRALNSTMPKLKDIQLKALYRNIVENYVKTGGAIEREVIDKATGKSIGMESVDVSKLLGNAEKTGDYSDLYDILSKSKDPRAKALASKMKGGMSALIAGAYNPGADKKEDKKEDKKDDKKGK